MRFNLTIATILVLVSATIGVAAQQPNAVQFTIYSVRSGDWSSPCTWEPMRVPVEGDLVQVRPEHVVIYDVDSPAAIRMVHVAGTLRFARDRSTSLTVGLVKIQPGDMVTEDVAACDQHPEPPPEGPGAATLEIGTTVDPLPANVKATIRLKQWPGTNASGLPALVVCGGRFEGHGAVMNRTWVKFGASAVIGSAAVTLAEPVTGWKAGDALVLTSGGGAGGREEAVVAAVDGTSLTLAAPVAKKHLGIGETRSEVANLSRNIVVESAEPLGTRGHCMYHRGSAGGVSYVEFRELGKKGVLGRYPLHFHLVGTTMEGAQVIGCSFHRSQNRWLTIHGTDGITARDCVGYLSVGNGFYLEDGTEQRNVLDRNLAIAALGGAKLPNQALPFDNNAGSGFWWANGNNTFTRNVSCENARYGYFLQAAKTTTFNPFLLLRGDTTPTDIRTIPMRVFEDNEAHSETFYGMWLGFAATENGPTETISPVNDPSIARRILMWKCHYSFRPEIQNLLLDGVRLIDADYGWYHPRLDGLVCRNLYILRPSSRPIGPSDDLHQFGDATFDGVVIDGYKATKYNPGLPIFQMAFTSPQPGHTVHVRGLQFVNSNPQFLDIADIGGSEAPRPPVENGIAYLFYDYFGVGRTARVVSGNIPAMVADGTYAPVPRLTGVETVAREIPTPEFPDLLPGVQ